MTPEYGTPLDLMSGHMSPQQHRNSPAFRDSPHSQRGYRPHRDSPLVYSPTHQEPPQHFGRPSSRKRGDMKESGRHYSSSSQQEDYHYGSSPAEICYGSSSNYEHDDNRYEDQNTHINDGQESGMKCHEFKVGFCILFSCRVVVHVYINQYLEVLNYIRINFFYKQDVTQVDVEFSLPFLIFFHVQILIIGENLMRLKKRS